MVGRRKGTSGAVFGLAIWWSFSAVDVSAEVRLVDAPVCRASGSVAGSAFRVPQMRFAQATDRKVRGLGLTLTGGRNGRAQVEGRLGELHFRKSVDAVGRFTLDLEVSRDTVKFDVDERGVRVSREGETVTLAQGVAGEVEFDSARRLLAGSRAVGLLRTAASAVMDADDDAPDSVAVLMADALVGMLTGDAGAPGRVARHLPRRARERTRRVAIVTSDCYRNWEQGTLIASYEWEDCALSFSIWDPARHVCAFRWFLQVESYWFTFLSCSGLSGFNL